MDYEDEACKNRSFSSSIATIPRDQRFLLSQSLESSSIQLLLIDSYTAVCCSFLRKNAYTDDSFVGCWTIIGMSEKLNGDVKMLSNQLY